MKASQNASDGSKYIRDLTKAFALDELDLKCNKVSAIFESRLYKDSVNQNESHAWTPMNELDWAGFKLTSIQPGVFNEFKQLKCLDLSGNIFEQLDKNSFVGLENLHELKLTAINLIHIGAHLWTHLGQVKKLDLSFNLITELDASSFFGLANLEELNLQHNCLTRIDAHTFDDLKQLKILDLDSNRIESIDERAFEGLVNLKEIHLHDNHLVERYLDSEKGLMIFNENNYYKLTASWLLKCN